MVTSDEANAKWEELKLGKGTPKKYMVLKINRESGQIEIEGEFGTRKDEGQEHWDKMVAELPPMEGRYVCYDFDFKTNDGRPQNKLSFIVWAPDDAPIKEKMLYASSKDAIKKKFTGIAHEIQGTDLEEMDYDYVLSKFK